MEPAAPCWTKRAKMGKIRWIIASLVALDILIGIGQAFAQRNEMPAGYPQSLEPALQALLGRLHEGNPSPGLLVRLAEAYFDLADDLLTDEAKRLAAYEAGAMAAKQAIELDEIQCRRAFFPCGESRERRTSPGCDQRRPGRQRNQTLCRARDRAQSQACPSPANDGRVADGAPLDPRWK